MTSNASSMAIYPTLQVCLYVFEPFVRQCVINDQCGDNKPHGLSYDIFTTIFRNLDYEFIVANYTVEQLDTDLASLLFENELGCEMFVTSWTLEDHTNTKAKNLSILYPHAQWWTTVAIPHSKIDYFKSFISLLKAYSLVVWIFWGIAGVSLLIALYYFGRSKKNRNVWPYVRALLPGQIGSLPLPEASGSKASRILYILFAFFIGNIMLSLYCNCLVVQLQTRPQKALVRDLEDLVNRVANKELRFVDTYDWVGSYDPTTNDAIRKLVDALKINSILVVDTDEELAAILLNSTNLVYLGYEPSVRLFWKKHQMCGSNETMFDISGQDWQFLEITQIEGGGWFAYLLMPSAIHLEDTMNRMISDGMGRIRDITSKYEAIDSNDCIHDHSGNVVRPIHLLEMAGGVFLLTFGAMSAAIAFWCEMKCN